MEAFKYASMVYFVRVNKQPSPFDQIINLKVTDTFKTNNCSLPHIYITKTYLYIMANIDFVFIFIKDMHFI